MSAPPPSPVTRAEFDAYAGDYDAAINEGLKFTGEAKEYFAEQRVQWLQQRLRTLGAAPRACLDFGCGTGTSATLLKRGLGLTDYTGYDPSADSVAEAQRLHSEGGFTFVADAGRLPREAFDLAFCNGVFHHIPVAARAEACRQVHASLKPGGWFAFWENNKWNPIVHLLMSRVPFDRDAVMLFPHEARRLLRQAGLNIVLTDSLFIFPASLAVLRPLEPRLCKLPIGGQYLVLARKP